MSVLWLKRREENNGMVLTGILHFCISLFYIEQIYLYNGLYLSPRHQWHRSVGGILPIRTVQNGRICLYGPVWNHHRCALCGDVPISCGILYSFGTWGDL